jgi:hypothetical protein
MDHRAIGSENAHVLWVLHHLEQQQVSRLLVSNFDPVADNQQMSLEILSVDVSGVVPVIVDEHPQVMSGRNEQANTV